MKPLKETPYFREAIHELNYPFGNYYLFDGFVVAEINPGVIYTWEQHGKLVSKDISDLYDNDGGQLIYITNRIHMYSVKPVDWLYFFKNSYTLKAYGVVGYTEIGLHSALLEKLFLKTKIARFSSLEDVILWAKNLSGNTAIAS